MSKKTEALKLALKKAFDLGKRYWQQADSDFTSQWRKADVTLASFNQLVEDTIREALAEQTALLAANKDLQNHFDALMNDYKKLSALCSSQGTRLMEYESSHEPESKPWVGLTRDERMSIINRLIGQDWVYALDAIEAKLKEKNA